MKTIIYEDKYKETQVLAKLKYYGENSDDLENEKEYYCVGSFLPKYKTFLVVGKNLEVIDCSIMNPGFEDENCNGGIWKIVEIYDEDFSKLLSNNNILLEKEKIDKTNEVFEEFDCLPPGSIVSLKDSDKEFFIISSNPYEEEYMYLVCPIDADGKVLSSQQNWAEEIDIDSVNFVGDYHNREWLKKPE